MRIYFQLDCGPKQEKLEVLTGALGKVLRTLLGEGANVFAHKKSGEVNANFIPIASITLPDEKEVLLQWNMPEVERLQLDKDKAAELFRNGGRPKVEWSS